MSFLLLGVILQFFDLGLQFGYLVLQLFLVRGIFGQNHLFLTKFLVDFGHRVDLVLGVLELLKYFFDAFSLNCVLMAKFLDEGLQTEVVLVELLVLSFLFFCVYLKSFELNKVI